MGEQVVNRDRALGSHDLVMALGRGLNDLHIIEFGNEFGDGVVQSEMSFFVQHHNGHAGYRLSHRGDTKDGVGLHGNLVFAILPASGVQPSHFAVSGDESDSSGDPILLDELLQLPA
jgi:hypothetical protein